MSKYDDSGCGLGCIGPFIYALVGYWSIDYLTNIMDHDLHWFWDLLIGIVIGWGAFWVALFHYIFL